MRPPPELDGAEVLWWAWSGAQPFGVMPSTDGTSGIEIYGLAICVYASGAIYRFSCDREWRVQNDALVDSAESAKHSVPAQYTNVPRVWHAR